MLKVRNSSNTAQNLIKHKKCVINFLADDSASFKEMVRLGWPGDKPEITDEALAMLVKVPRVFLPTVLKGCVKWAEENNVRLIDTEQMKIINDKRSKEKSK